MVSAQVLTILEGLEKITKYSDASKGLQSQYNMEMLMPMPLGNSNNMKSYPTHDLELVVVAYALKIWCHYLHDDKCTPITKVLNTS